jgi:hypothetical protein
MGGGDHSNDPTGLLGRHNRHFKRIRVTISAE